MAAVCRHCRRNKVSRSRGLCWTCYYTPGVRDLYPVDSRYGRRGIGHGEETTEGWEPTDALPGTPEKYRVLCERAERGQPLWHPKDARRER